MSGTSKPRANIKDELIMINCYHDIKPAILNRGVGGGVEGGRCTLRSLKISPGCHEIDGGEEQSENTENKR